jgi:hypothetical protein
MSPCLFFIVTQPDNSMDIALNVAYGNKGLTNYRVPIAPSLGRVFSVRASSKDAFEVAEFPNVF